MMMRGWRRVGIFRGSHETRRFTIFMHAALRETLILAMPWLGLRRLGKWDIPPGSDTASVVFLLNKIFISMSLRYFACKHMQSLEAF